MKQICVTILAIFLLITLGQSKPPSEFEPTLEFNKILDGGKYINANNLLMFVSNVGVFATNLGGIFEKTDGLYFPYTSIADIESYISTKTVMYASGIWLGGIDNNNGDILVTVAEYSEEYSPGPMTGGTFQTDAFSNPNYRVYKLYKDSLADNPNLDYLQWPAEMGAPVDGSGIPVMKGDQMLWTVFNDADPLRHTNNSGGTDPMGIEIQQTVWAMDESGIISILQGINYSISKVGDEPVSVRLIFLDNDALINANYQIDVEIDLALGPVWHLYNLTDNIILAQDQTNFSGDDNYPVFDGIMFKVIQLEGFKSFEVVSNGAGPVNPPEAGALYFQDFPVPTGVDPNGAVTDGQQVGAGHWAIHTGDNGSRGSYEAFLLRTFREDSIRLNNLGYHDWEWRFTGSNDNPGVGGGYCVQAFTNGVPFWVPFELWRVGVGTPDDASDDVRLIPWVLDDDEEGGPGDDVFDLSAWGSEDIPEGCGSGGCDHSGSGGTNDPFTDWVYWNIPANETPGTAGYDAFEAVMLTDPDSWGYAEVAVMDRTVLLNWNGGSFPAEFDQDMPEIGTVFRLKTHKVISGSSQFSINVNRPETITTTGPEGLSVYVEYKLFNKGINTVNDCYISLWFDPDIGGASDDLVACDTLNNSFYSYNATNNDLIYSNVPPVIGGKILYGPIIDSVGEYAIFDGKIISDHINLGMTSFQKYYNGTDPQNSTESFNYMRGFNRDGFPLSNGTKYAVPGDPVNGTGDLDVNPADRRMMASMGPFTFSPGDSQYVMVKLAVGQGTDRLNSITVFKEVVSSFHSLGCCEIPGDANHDGSANITDLTYFIDYMFHGGQAPVCYEEFDNNGNCEDGISNLTYFVDWMFQGGLSPVDCHICN